MDHPGGALAVQKDFLRHFQRLEGEQFFFAVRTMVRDFCVLHLAPRSGTGVAVIASNMKQKEGYSDRFMADAHNLQTLLLFLQLNCEGHFRDMQMYVFFLFTQGF